jgi:hypothetical protein
MHCTLLLLLVLEHLHVAATGHACPRLPNALHSGKFVNGLLLWARLSLTSK